MEEQKARSESGDDSVPTKEKIAAAKRTDKAAREFFAMDGSDIDKADW